MQKVISDLIFYAIFIIILLGFIGMAFFAVAIAKGDVDTVTLEPVSVQEQIRNEQLIQGLGGY